MNIGAIYDTVRKYRYQIFESSTSSTCYETHVFESDIRLSFNSDSDDSDSYIDSDNPGLSGTSQELRDFCDLFF